MGSRGIASYSGFTRGVRALRGAEEDGGEINLVHVHLLLNHVPVIAVPIAMVLLAMAIHRESSEVAKSAMLLMFATAIVTIVVFLTGEPAEELVEKLPGISESMMEAHEEAALVATIATGVLGGVALVALVSKIGRPISRKVIWTSLLLAGVTWGMIAWTANLGGQIRHTEIRGMGVGAVPNDTGSRDERHDQ
jgi:uncharacterized membrane protein